MLTPQDVLDVRFNPTKFRPGYDQDVVDAFLDRVADALRARQAGEPSGLSAAEVDAMEFAPSRFREGYDMRDVDRFLDLVRVELGGTSLGSVPGLVAPRKGLFGRGR